MSLFTRFVSFIALVAFATVVGYTAADAHRVKRHHHHKHHHYVKKKIHKGVVCQARVEGRATGQGLFGAGSAAARSAAQTDWEAKTAAKYGQAFASLGRASLVRWDCSKNAILKAKCVVTARPCN
jgi:hypothetical protein